MTCRSDTLQNSNRTLQPSEFAQHFNTQDTHTQRILQTRQTSNVIIKELKSVDYTQDLTESRPFTTVEFCAGYSGISLGVKRAVPSLRVIAVSEIEAFAVANLVSKMEAGLLDPAPIWPDLKTFPNKEFHGKVDLLVAGFPCQPFSAAGKRGGDEDPRHLFPFIKQSLMHMQPRAVFLENVEGIISSKLKGDGWNDPEGTPVLLHVLRELERVGYRATAGVFSASEVGAPHQRKRVFILGHRIDPGLEGFKDCGGSPEDRTQSHDEQSLRCCRAGSEVGLWPSRPGEQQYDWEPPRVVGNPVNADGRTNEGRVSDSGDERGAGAQGDQQEILRAGSETQPPLGRDSDGLTDRLDDAELYHSCDNRTDELRLLGNGVVPATAERAWRVLSERFN